MKLTISEIAAFVEAAKILGRAEPVMVDAFPDSPAQARAVASAVGRVQVMAEKFRRMELTIRR